MPSAPRKIRLSEQAVQLSRLTRSLARCCQIKEEQIFGRFGLTSAEGRVLLEVAEGPCTASSLATRLNLVRSRLSPLVESLVAKNLISRVGDAHDRRVHSLSLTPYGQQIAQAAAAFQISVHEELLQRFEPSRRQELLTSLDELHAAIENIRSQLVPGDTS
jgi:DNA-binding MarR family transcriptional regulator